MSAEHVAIGREKLGDWNQTRINGDAILSNINYSVYPHPNYVTPTSN